MYSPSVSAAADATGDLTYPVYNPANRREVVGRVRRDGPGEVDSAVHSANAAKAEWGKLSHRERARLIKTGIEAVNIKATELATLYTREHGKPIRSTRGEFAMMATRETGVLASAEMLDEERVMPFTRGRSIVRRLPWGVVASIIPWNSPVVLGFAQVVSALLCGNTVVAKPPESSPLALGAALETLAAELPAGVLKVLYGDRHNVGGPLIRNAGVAKIVFTGSTVGGLNVVRDSATSVKHLTLELGGNDAAIVMDDLEFDQSRMDQIAAAVFPNCGQVCMAIKRIYVSETRHDRFVEAFVAAANRLRVGNGLLETTHIGPAHQRSAVQRVADLADDAAAQGATIIKTGIQDESVDFENGNFIMPIVAAGASHGCRLAAEEQFAPIVPIIRYANEAQAISMANDSEYGLGGSVWSADNERALAIARQLDSGTVWVNAHGPGMINPQAPYGGRKQSGVGRKAGSEGLAEYSDVQTLTVPS